VKGAAGAAPEAGATAEVQPEAVVEG
jgi:hypothetical protein